MKTRAFGLLAVAVTALTVAPARALTYPGEFGPELDLSAGDVSAERPAVAHRSGPNGYDNFIVVWKAHDLAGDSIRARFVEKVGSNVVPGAPFTVKGALVGVTLSAPAVAMDNTGRFTIAWGEARALQSCVIVRRFGPQAQPLPSAVVESCQQGSAGTLEAPQVAAGSNAGGEVAVGWTRRIAADRHRLLMRTISPAGTLRPTAVVSTEAGSDPRPRLAVGGGQVFVVWQNPLAMVRRFSIAGVALAGAAQLPAYGGHHPVVGSNRNGQFAAAWAEGGVGEHSTWVGGWKFDAQGHPLPHGLLDPLVYDALLPDGDVFRPDIASDRVGGLALVWESELYDDDATAIVGRIYNSLGDELSPIFLANVTQAGAQRNPAVWPKARVRKWYSPPALG